jgi:hypothetical protein
MRTPTRTIESIAIRRKYHRTSDNASALRDRNIREKKSVVKRIVKRNALMFCLLYSHAEYDDTKIKTHIFSYHITIILFTQC